MRTVLMTLALSLFGCDLDENRSAHQDKDDVSVNQTNTSGRQLDALTDAGRVEDGGMLPSDGYLDEDDAQVVDLDAARPSPSCEDRCREAGRVAERQCLADGGGADDCRLAGMRAVRSCIERRCSEMDGSTGEQSCEDRCREAGRTAERQCLADGGDADECRSAGMRAVRNCIGRRCGEMDGGTGAQSCEDRCSEAGRMAERQCLADGGAANNCRQVAMEVQRDCVSARCDMQDAGTEPADCESACRRSARDVQQDCLRSGGREEMCSRRARDQYRMCTETRCGDAGVVEDDSRACIRDCIESGGDRAECFAQCGESP